ncbi:MAG: AI-2E family transporter [Bacilli bacterium]
MKQKDKKTKNFLKVSYYCLVLLLIILFLGVIYALTLIFKEWKIFKTLTIILKVISPLFIGFVLAWLLNPLLNKLEKKGIKRCIGVSLIFLSLLIILFLFTWAIIPGLVDNINDLVSSVPEYLKDAENLIDNIFSTISKKSTFDTTNIQLEFYSSINAFATRISTNLPLTIMKFITSFISALGVIGLGLVIGFYLLFDFNNFNTHISNILPKKYRKGTLNLLEEIGTHMHRFVDGTLKISFILFIASVIGFNIIGLHSSILFAFFCSITNIIPYIGPYIGGIPAVIVGLSQSPLIGCLVLGVIIITQILESFFLHPIVLGKKMELSPVTIVVSLLIFGYFFGIIGMIVAAPTVDLIKIIYCHITKKYKIEACT